MGCRRLLISAIPFIILLISTSSDLTSFHVQARKLSQTHDNSQKTTSLNESKTIIWRAQIGSRPPRCEQRCGSCARCQAIQVPTNGRINHSSTAAAWRDEGSSNYKPISWKCKCGNLIFNP